MATLLAVIELVAWKGGVVAGSHVDAPADYREAVVTPSAPTSMNPLMNHGDHVVGDLAPLLYRSLLRFDPQSLPIADLADTWSTSGDGRTYRFHITDHALWSDGKMITSSDVAASVGFVQSADFPDAQFGSTWRDVKVNQIDASTIELILPAPRGSFAAQVAQLPIAPQNALRVADLHAANSAIGVTSGPYRVTTLNNARLELQANRRAVPVPHMQHIEFQFVSTFSAALQLLDDGKVDALTASTPEERSKVNHRPGVNLHSITTYGFVDVIFNEQTAGLGDTSVRAAIANAIDRRAITKVLGGGGVEEFGSVPPSIGWVGQPAAYPVNRTAASESLTSQGWVLGASGQREKAGQALSFRLVLAATPWFRAAGQELALELSTIGVHVAVTSVPPDQMQSVLVAQRAFDLAIGSWELGPDPDMSRFWRSNAQPPLGVNISGTPKDPFLDASLDTMATASAAAVRAKARARVDERLLTDLPAVFLYAPVSTYVVSSAMKNVSVPSSGFDSVRFASITSWARG